MARFRRVAVIDRWAEGIAHDEIANGGWAWVVLQLPAGEVVFWR